MELALFLFPPLWSSGHAAPIFGRFCHKTATGLTRLSPGLVAVNRPGRAHYPYIVTRYGYIRVGKKQNEEHVEHVT